MTTSTAADVQRRRRDRRRRPVVLPLLGVLVVAVVAAGAGLLVLRTTRDGVLPGARVAGTEVGGRSAAEVRRIVADLAAERAAAPVTVRRPAVGGDPSTAAEVRSPAADLGYRLDVAATVDRVMARGRQANPLLALGDHLRAFATATDVAAVDAVDADALRRWATATARELALEPAEGAVGFEGTTVTRRDPVPGVTVDAAQLSQDAASVAGQTDGATLDARVRVEDTMTTVADVDAAVAQAERAVDGPVTLRRGGAVLELAPEEIAAVFRLGFGPGGEGLLFSVDPAVLTAAAGDVATLETPPVDAQVRLDGATVVVEPSQDGFAWDPELAATQVAELALREGPAEAELVGVVAPPARTTAAAEALQIREPVGTFSTEFAAGQSRVTNIQRIAELVDGVVIPPGGTFSVNDHVGERTADKGFVGGGAIQEGELVDELGGGVSQFATTLYNGAYFGGLDLVEYKAHSQYFSRYPVGREATLNFPNVDLVIGNPSPYGVLVDTSSSATSVTVTIWSTTWVGVESLTSERRSFTSPETLVRRTGELPPGAERVVQGGSGEGFTVTDTRVLRYLDGREEREDRVTVYGAAPRIVERGV